MPTYTITELAREFDITPRAIRFYEDQGLISPKREGAGGRTRVYSGRERTRLKLTLRGKRLGLTLSEIKSLVDMYESPKDSSAQLKRFLTVLARHRETLEQQREDIEVTLAEIAAHEDECKRLLDGGVSAAAAKPAKKAAAKAASKPAVKTAAKAAGARAKQAA
jgi:DNA-binding transcriptional MerR regulator